MRPVDVGFTRCLHLGAVVEVRLQSGGMSTSGTMTQLGTRSDANRTMNDATADREHTQTRSMVTAIDGFRLGGAAQQRTDSSTRIAFCP